MIDQLKGVASLPLISVTVGFVLGALAGTASYSKYWKGIPPGSYVLSWGITGFEVGGILGILIVLVALAKGVDLDM